MSTVSTDPVTAQYDVVIVGASIAGCTAAVLYGRAGLRVALLEKHRSADTAKRLCGHFILGGARETLRRLGIEQDLLDAGANTGRFAGWNPAGWVEMPDGIEQPINLRRTKLDPMLRALAAGTDGVDLRLGHIVDDVIEKGERVVGVEARTLDGERRRFHGALVVGADGYRSKVAEVAGVPEKTAANGRFAFWAYYRGVGHRGPAAGQLWFLDPDVAILTPSDDGLTQLIAFPTKGRLAEFLEDRPAALEAYIRALPDGPDLSCAERVSQVIGTTDYPMIRRNPTPRPGLALIGDAATTSDPVNAVGCGWAFQSAEWLADATVPALRGEVSLSSGLRTYRRRHRFIDWHDAVARDEAKARQANPLQLALRTAAVHDEEIRARFFRFAMRLVPVTHLLNPKVLVRGLRVAWQVRRGESGAAVPLA